MPFNRPTLAAAVALASACAVGLARAQEPAAPAQAAPDPKAVVESACTACHGLDFVSEHRKDHDGWDFTVRRMIDKGAELPFDAIPSVVDYLAKTYPPTGAAADKPTG